MKTAVLDSQPPRTYLLVFDPDEEVMSGLLSFVLEKQITAGHFTAIGAVSKATLGFFDRKTKDCDKIPQDGQAEVLSLIGDVAVTEKGEPGVHAHMVLGLPDGSAKGGHLIEATVDRLWLVNNGTVTSFEGDMEEYRDLIVASGKKKRRAKADR